jgi:hypothetical protein
MVVDEGQPTLFWGRACASGRRLAGTSPRCG